MKARSLSMVALAGAIVGVLFGGAALAATATPSKADVLAAKAALDELTEANAPESEDVPTDLAECPFGDQLVTDLAAIQLRYDEAQATPTVVSSVFLDESVDQGLHSVGCTVEYSEDTFDTPRYLSVVAYADPQVKTKAYSKALAKERGQTASALIPPKSSAAGGKIEGYCLKNDGIPDGCSYVWSRNGLYVEIDTSVLNSGNFEDLPGIAAAVVDALASSES